MEENANRDFSFIQEAQDETLVINSQQKKDEIQEKDSNFEGKKGLTRPTVR